MRKHYIEGQTRGADVRIAAEAVGYAATVPGARAAFVGESCVVVTGEATAEQVAAFAKQAEELVDRQWA